MKRFWSFTAWLLLFMQMASAQIKVQDKNTPKLSFTWQVITNTYEGKSQSRSVLVCAAGTALPAKGWKIYFNFPRQVIPGSVTGGVEITHINGDFFCLSPAADFKGIAAGQFTKIELTSADWVINVSDAPQGFYLVWDNEPAKGYDIPVSLIPSTKPEQLMRSPLDKVNAANPAATFAQNKIITDLAADSLKRVFPTPITYRDLPGKFVLDGNVQLQAPAAFKQEEQYLRQTISGLILPGIPPKATGNTIVLQQKPMAEEAYELLVGNDQVIISAATGAGIFYGIQSLKTLIDPKAYRQKQKTITIKNVAVTDAPRFGYRAFMLDVARNFQSKQAVLKLIDVMSLYKINVLHFHLTDDEGWRIEIPELPELTTVGSRRGHTLANTDYLQPAFGSGPDVNNPHASGYYSKADFISILQYATQRHIRVIPEIESPGHARAAIKAMDARYRQYTKLGQKAQAEMYMLRDLNDTSKYRSVQHYNDNVMDVSLASTYNFISTVTTSLVQMYREAGAPLQTIHFGGDEVPAGAWQGSPAFNKLVKADPVIKSTDDLWLYYYTKVNAILRSNSLYLTAWEETGLVKALQNNKKVDVINPGLLDKNVHLEVWNNVIGWGAEDLAYKQANAGYKVILSCVSNLYFDMAYEKAFDEPGYYWGSYTDVDKLFKFIPYNYFKNTTVDQSGRNLNRAYLESKEQLTATGKANIIGLQGALFGETLGKGAPRLEYMLLPKLLGLAARAWAADPEWATSTDTLTAATLYDHAWSVFVNTIGKRELPRLDYYSGGFNYRIPEPGAVIQHNMIVVNTQLPGFRVYYTTDGSMPTIHSNLYTTPFNYLPGVKMALFNAAGRSGRAIDLDQ